MAWLRRARRYAPDDPTPLVSLAGALLATGEMAEAAGCFETVAGKADAQAAWLGVALARLRLGQPAAAAQAMAAALSRHRWHGGPDASALPDRVAAAAGVPGWCGLDDDEAVVVRPSGLAVELAVDGCATAGGAVPSGAVSVAVTAAGRHLLGSPLQVRDIRRVEGMVEAQGGGLAGWAWHPGDSDRDPVLRVRDAAGRELPVLADDADTPSLRPLMRPRRFAVPSDEIAKLVAPLAVVGADGRHLAGSPLHPTLEAQSAVAVARSVARAWPVRGRKTRFAPMAAVPAEVAVPAAAAPSDPKRRVVVVVPVHRGMRQTLICLESVLATVPQGTAVLVVDDASPEPELAAALDALAGGGRIGLLRHASNVGFPAAANAGMRAAVAMASDADLALLNSDTQAPPEWLERLREAVHSAPDIGTATPLSNDASIVSYPDPAGGAPPSDGPDLRRIARQAAAANAGMVVDLPTGIGFCLYVRRECLIQTGLLREDVFAQGYGEENDFCLRARHLGWRHVAVPAAYVAHRGAQSFGTAREALAARNIAVLERLYPGYGAMIRAWIERDPLAPARRRLDAARWRAQWRAQWRALWRAQWRGRTGGSVLLVTHDGGGGVERCVRERLAAIAAAGQRAVVLRPVLERHDPDRRYVPGLCAVSDAAGRAAYPNLVFRLPDELGALAALLRPTRPSLVEVHHLLGHEPSVLRLPALLRVPYEVRAHDYAWFCARVTLVGAGERYCGEPPVAGCERCVDDLGSRLEEPIRPAALVARSAAVLAGARRVVTPSHDMARRLRRHFPAVAAEVLPHEPDRYGPPDPPPAAGTRRVCVVGGIGIEKGYDVLLACARDAADRRLDLSFHVVGHTVDDDRLLGTGRVEITGPFEEADAVALIRAQRAAIGFVPGICAETWSFTLGQAWAAGLEVLAFDIGAVAERVRRTGRGWLLPLGAPPASVNAALLAPGANLAACT